MIKEMQQISNDLRGWLTDFCGQKGLDMNSETESNKREQFRKLTQGKKCLACCVAVMELLTEIMNTTHIT